MALGTLTSTARPSADHGPEHLDLAVWQAREAAHRQRVDPWVRPRLARRRAGERHPVDDFLFEYYTFRPGQLARWHPGPWTTLEPPVAHLTGATGFLARGGRVGVDPSAVARQASLLPGIGRLLAATAGRRPRIGCSALHEWAMVYRVPQSEVRHADWPLRLSPQQIAEVVDGIGLRCTHFDAYRFFAAQAVPLNAAPLSRSTQIESEQPGCLHATMDLYKWAYRLSPLVSAELIADAFELAREARGLDMRAAPYDLAPLGIRPIRMETAQGRNEFARLQRDLAQRGQGLRSRLIEAIGAATTWWTAAQRAS